MGISENLTHIRDKKALGIGSLMVEIRKSYQEKLTESMLKSWHKENLDECQSLHQCWKIQKWAELCK